MKIYTSPNKGAIFLLQELTPNSILNLLTSIQRERNMQRTENKIEQMIIRLQPRIFNSTTKIPDHKFTYGLHLNTNK